MHLRFSFSEGGEMNNLQDLLIKAGFKVETVSRGGGMVKASVNDFSRLREIVEAELGKAPQACTPICWRKSGKVIATLFVQGNKSRLYLD